ncbi:hypothetical protein ABXK61_16110 [Burkholderia sola]|uniref:hypothetical protein n=1 Tax=Burkholderia TaxID=32008 RepID=UPI001FD7F347|nr:hypothetical protein [Burkholderia sp. AcTa6-5]
MKYSYGNRSPERRGCSINLRLSGQVDQNWPTPVAQDDNKSPEAYKRMRMEKLGRTGEATETITSLQVKVLAWPMPRATDGTKGGPNQHGSAGDPMLPSMSAQWATPNVPNGGRSVSAEVVANRGKTENGKRQIGLESETRHWPTPTACTENSIRGSGQDPEIRRQQGHAVNLQDAAHGMASSLRQAPVTNDGGASSPDVQTSRPRLNPAFACWLMGWPVWWTNPGITSSVKSEMALYRSKLRQRLSSFFNAQDCA